MEAANTASCHATPNRRPARLIGSLPLQKCNILLVSKSIHDMTVTTNLCTNKGDA